MRAGTDRRQRVSVSVVMIKSSRKPFAFVDSQIELELVAGTSRRIWPDRVPERRTAAAGAVPAFPSRQNTRGVVEKLRKLGERDRSMVIERADGVTSVQELCERRDGFRRRGRELLQINFSAGPAGPYRRKRRHNARI